jgi:hypothetical protein
LPCGLRFTIGPREWTNLADNPQYSAQKQEMKQRLHTMVPAISEE